jgi:hypothetical protein
VPVTKAFEGAAKIVSGGNACHLDDAARKAPAETLNTIKPWLRA